MEKLLYRNNFDFGIELKTKKEHKILHCLFSERIIFIEILSTSIPKSLLC